MDGLDPPRGSVDLIGSEGAANSLTFRGALRAWRPRPCAGGLAVRSEMNRFGGARPSAAADFRREAHPRMEVEAEKARSVVEL